MSDRNHSGSRAAGEHLSDEALADFVDGTSTEDERSLVEAHLAACQVCSDQVELARSSVAATSGVEEAPAPGLDPAAIVSVAGKVVPIGSRTAAPAEPRNRTASWLGVVGGVAAAMIAGVFVVGALRGGGGGSSTSAQAPSSASANGHPGEGSLLPVPSPGVVTSPTTGPIALDGNFTRASVAVLARSLANGSELSFLSTPQHGPTQPRAADVAAATACAQQSAGTSDEPVLVIRATFEGRPAFLIAFKPAHTSYARVVVTPVGSCAILYQALYQGSASTPGA